MIRRFRIQMSRSSTCAFGAIIACLSFCALVTGCGNQMFRQPSYQPLDTPRALPPVGAIPVALSLAPSDARGVDSPAYGDLTASETIVKPQALGSAPPILPPPDLSDNALNDPTPKSVDTIESPYQLTDSHLISGGNALFLNRCVQCHNVGGVGYGVVGSYLVPHPPDLSSSLVQKRSDGALYWVIGQGQGKMPGFADWTTPSERWSLVAYVRSLKGNNGSGAQLLSPHVSDTTMAPYPVYGEPGFEHGANTAPFKALDGAPSPISSRVYTDSTEPQELITRKPQ